MTNHKDMCGETGKYYENKFMFVFFLLIYMIASTENIIDYINIIFRNLNQFYFPNVPQFNETTNLILLCIHYTNCQVVLQSKLNMHKFSFIASARFNFEYRKLSNAAYKLKLHSRGDV